jgi:hypothetical protein
MPLYSARSIDIRLLASNVADSTIADPVLDEPQLAKLQATACKAVLADSVPLHEEVLPDPVDDMRLRFVGEEDAVPVYVARATRPDVMGVRESVAAMNAGATSSILVTAPLALAVDIRLGSKAAGKLKRSGNNDPKHDTQVGAAPERLRYDVLINGTLVDSDFVSPPSEAEAPVRILVSGKRVGKSVERPVVLCPPSLTARGELLEARTNRGQMKRINDPNTRWEAINAELRSFADELEHWHCFSPLSAFFRAFADVELPEKVKKLPGMKPKAGKTLLFGTVDVVISRGRAQRARWWKKLEVAMPLEYTKLKDARDKAKEAGEEDEKWYGKYVSDHVETQLASSQRLESTGRDDAGELVSGSETSDVSDAYSQSSIVRARGKETILPSTLLSRPRAPKGLSAGVNTRQLNTGLLTSDKRRDKGKTRPRHDPLGDLTRSPSKRARISMPNLSIPPPHTANPKIDSPMTGLDQSHALQALVARDRPDKAKLAQYHARLRDGWREGPVLCANSSLTFAEDGVWRDGGRGGHLRHVEERRVGRFDDDEVVHAVRFIVGV